jgi:hypothetical protein
MSIKVSTQVKGKFSPFPQSDLSMGMDDFRLLFGITETIEDIKDRFVVEINFSGSNGPSLAGLRAAGNGVGSDRNWRWLTWITGLSGGMTANNNWEYREQAVLAGITPGNPNWNSFSWDDWISSSCVRKWYEWGARRFHLHFPFGKTPLGVYGATLGSSQSYINSLVAAGRTLTSEPVSFAPDCFLLCKEGFVDPFTGQTGNDPMPWMTDDVVDGKVQGFVPLFKALTSGSSAGLSTEIWERLTGIGGPSAWFNPSDPIDITIYTGGMGIFDGYFRHKQMSRGDAIVAAGFSGANTNRGTGVAAVKQRLFDSFDPIRRAGCRVGIDALVGCPGPTVGVFALMGDEFKSIGNYINEKDQRFPPTTFSTPHWRSFAFRENNIDYYHMPARDLNGQVRDVAGGTFGDLLDRVWWEFYRDYLVPSFGKNNIYSEAIPWVFQVNNQKYPNPYVGLPTLGGEEYMRSCFNGISGQSMGNITSLRSHYLGELGEVEVRKHPSFSSYRLFVGISGGINQDKFIPGDYWYLKPFSSPGGKLASNLPSPQASNWSTDYPFTTYGILPESNPQGFTWAYMRTDEGGVFDANNNTFGYGHLWGYVAAQFLSQYQPHRRYAQPYGVDPTPVGQDRTKQTIAIPNTALKPIQGYALNHYWQSKNAPGTPEDFITKFPKIYNFADYIAGLKNGYNTLGPGGTFSPSPSRVIDTTALSRELDSSLSYVNRAEKISGTMWLTIQDWDAFSQSKLSGSSGGQFYVPSVTADIDPAKLRQFLDTSLKGWLQKHSFYPKYIAWKLTEQSDSDNPSSFEIERYLGNPKTIPLTDDEYSLTYALREPYFVLKPQVTYNPGGVDSEQLVGVGYDIPYFTGGVSEFVSAENLVLALLDTTKKWIGERGIGLKLGIANVPFLPKKAFTIWQIDGTQAGATVLEETSVGWNSKAFPKQGRIGQDGWYSEEETEKIKKRIRLEYRKRTENITSKVDVVFPNIFDTSNEMLAIDDNVPLLKQWHREILNLTKSMRGISAWAYNIPNSTPNNTSIPPALKGKSILPMISYSHMGNESSSIVEGDPKTINLGELFDHDQVHYELIDWIRDEYLRVNPLGFASSTVDGMSVWNNWQKRALNALKSSSYSGKTADRDMVYKWLVADQGIGVTIDWGNSGDVYTKIKQFFSLQQKLTKNYLARFNRGYPRRDVVNPYSWVPFAASWGGGDGVNGQHTAVIGGTKITDIVPMLKPGISSGQFRVLGYTGSIPTVDFNDFVFKCKNTPKGRRVVMPYYWLKDPFGDGEYEDYYKSSSDGMTYAGSLPYKTGETPGQVKFLSPWCYKQNLELKQSLANFFHACHATGAKIDYIAHDQEAFTGTIIGSPINTWSGPFSPTGQPGIRVNAPDPDGITFAYVQAYPSWLNIPDPRRHTTFVQDPRFTSEINPYNGLSFGGAIKKSYLGFAPNYDNIPSAAIQSFNPFEQSPILFTPELLTTERIMEYYTLEGPTGISAATGPATCTALAPPYGYTNKETPQLAQNGYLYSPFRSPFIPLAQGHKYNASGGVALNYHLTWYAHINAGWDWFMGKIFKESWIDNIAGFTIPEMRAIKYSHYEVVSAGVTEGVFTRDNYGHSTHIHERYPGIDSAPNMYATLADYMYKNFSGAGQSPRYKLNPTNDRERHHFEIYQTEDIPNGLIQFATGQYSARSYIAFLCQMSQMRAMLRYNGNSYMETTPWVNSSYGNFRNSFSKSYESLVGHEKTDSRYLKELYLHLLLSGTKYFNFFFDQTLTSFEAGMTMMQETINDWKRVTEGYRVQPISTIDGSQDTLQERIVMEDVGGNHVGATGMFMSGGRILTENRGKIQGGISEEEYLWRITAAPQGVTLYLVETGNITDLAPEIYLGDERGVWIKRYGISDPPRYKITRPNISVDMSPLNLPDIGVPISGGFVPSFAVPVLEYQVGGIETQVRLRVSFDEDTEVNLYPGGDHTCQFRIKKNGTVVTTTNHPTGIIDCVNPPSPCEFTVISGDNLSFEFFTDGEQTNFNVKVTNLGTVTNPRDVVVGSFRCKYVSTGMTAEQVYYVNASGNDENNGLSSSAPLKSINKALELTEAYYGIGNVLPVRIQVASGPVHRILREPIFIKEGASGRTKYCRTTIAGDESRISVLSGGLDLSLTGTALPAADVRRSRFKTTARSRIRKIGSSTLNTAGMTYPIDFGVVAGNVAFVGTTVDVWSGARIGFGDVPTSPQISLLSTNTGVVYPYNIKPMTLARFPGLGTGGTGEFANEKTGIIQSIGSGGNYPMSVPGISLATFTYPSGSTYALIGTSGATWANDSISPIYLHGFWRYDWSDEVLKLTGLCASTRGMTVSLRSKDDVTVSAYGLAGVTQCNVNSPSANPSPRRWFATNVIEELDDPGEYWIDRTSGNTSIYLIPYTTVAETSSIRISSSYLAGGVTWAPGTVEWTSGNLIQVASPFNTRDTYASIIKMKEARNITIKRFAIDTCSGSGIEMNLCKNIEISQCSLRSMRKHGIVVVGGSNVNISDSQITDVGLCGVILASGNRQTLTSANHIVQRTTIKRWGKQSASNGHGVYLSGVGNTVKRCIIADGNGKGIFFVGNNHIIEQNRLKNLNFYQDDMGAIYKYADLSSAGTIIRHNILTDIGTKLPGGPYWDVCVGNSENWVHNGCAIYIDYSGGGDTIEGNVFYKCKSLKSDVDNAIFIGGTNIPIVNNIFIDCTRASTMIKFGVGNWNNLFVNGTAGESIKQATFNVSGDPWYETGYSTDFIGPGDPRIGYTPHSYYETNYGLHTMSPSTNFNYRGLYNKVDIRTSTFKAQYPWIEQLIGLSGATVTLDLTGGVKLNLAKNNVCIGISGSLASDAFFEKAYSYYGSPQYGGFNASGTYIDSLARLGNYFPNVILSQGESFAVSPTGLQDIQAESPQFVNINEYLSQVPIYFDNDSQCIGSI